MISGILTLVLLAAEGEGSASGRAPVVAGCTNPRLVVDREIDSRWAEAVQQLCRELDSMQDADPSAQLRISETGKDVLLRASLTDGRKAERLVKSPEALQVIALGLVTLPPPETAAAVSSASPVTLPSQEPSPLPSSVSQRQDAPPVAPRPPMPVAAVEVGAALIQRLSGSALYLSSGFSGYAGAHVSNWLFAISVRYAPFETVTKNAPPGFEMDSVGAGFLVARRLGRAPAVDLGGVASFVEQTQSYTPSTVELTKSQTEVRFGVLSRIFFGQGALRGALSLEAEVGPGRLRRSTRLDGPFPLLPAWSLGLGIGGTWEDR